MSEFESLGLRGGIWQGVVQRAAPPGRLLLIHAGRRVAEARVTPEGEGRWRVAIAIPAERLSDGVQTFLLLEDPAESDGAQPAPGAVVAEIVSSTRFGFMTMERNGPGWRLEAWDASGQPLTSCTLDERKAACTPIADPYAKP